MPLARKTLLEILIDQKKITPEIAQQLKLEHLTEGNDVIETVIERKYATRNDVMKARAEELGVPYVDITANAIPQELLKLVTQQVAKHYRAIPFELDQVSNTLSVAMESPLDFQARQFLEQKTGKRIKPFFSDPASIRLKVDQEYAQNLATEVTEALKETATPFVKTVVAEKISDIIREPPIARIVSTILEFAAKSRASDVHIEAQEKRTRVRYRIDGILYEKLILPRSVHDALISRIKILSDMKIDERRLPQDGRFNFKLGGDEIDLRVSTLPTIHGEKVVMRLLRKTGGIPELVDLGLRGLALKNLEESMTRPYGIVLVTGPTGSGKTTTLYSVLSRINKTTVNISTLEDPVEYMIPGVNQVQINPVAGLTFANGLRSFLRQDPNVILVGEIRDKETASLAIQAALTGHLVFSTLHTNDAATAIPRLMDMEAEPFLVSSVLHAIVAQRICRKICPSCKQSYEPDQEIMRSIKALVGQFIPANKKIVLYKGRGCDECNHNGYLGRVGVFEVLRVTEKVAKMVISKATSADIDRQGKSEGMISMKQDGFLKALDGITTLEEVLRVAEE